MEKLTIEQFFFDMVLWFSFLATNCRFLTSNARCEVAYCKDNNYAPLFLFLLVFCTFGFVTGDYFNYLELYKRNTDLSAGSSGQHVEAVYLWLLKNLPKSFALWRFVVWGMAAVLMVATFKSLRVPAKTTNLVFLLSISVVFASFRNTLGFVALFYGSTFLFSNRGNKIFNYVVFGIFLTCSLFLHRSMFIFAALFCVALIPIGKKTYLLSILLFPVLYKLIDSYAYQLLGSSLISEDSAAHGVGYLESDYRVDTTLMGYVQLLIWRLPIYAILIFSVWNIYFKKQKVDYAQRVYLNATYSLVYMSLLWYGQEVSAFLTSRFHDSAMFFFSVFLSMYIPTRPKSKLLRRSLWVLLFANMYNFAYQFYKNFL